MTASGPNGVIAAALFAKLNVTAVKTTAGATGGVWLNLAPQGTTMPYVIIQWQGGGDDNDHPTRSRNTVWTIKALAATAAIADTIDAACDTLLHNGSLSVTGYNTFWLRREGDVAYQEVDAAGNPSVFHSGGMYRVRNEKS